MLTFGGFLLLSGRLGDLYGNRRVLLGGVAAFTVSSVACAFAPTAGFLVVGRAVQGLGGAAVSAVALALIMGLFSDPGERAKAMGVFGFVMSGGGAVGVLLGGVLTGLFTWHWIFLVNVPVGLAVWVLVTRLVADHRPEKSTARLDVPGAGLVTVALMLAVYGVVGGNEAGWTSGRTLGILAASVVLLAAFVVREARVEHPLVPLRLFTLRNVVVSQVVGVLWAGAMFACFFLTALYMQGVLGYDALQVGLAYLPSCAVMAAMSLRRLRPPGDAFRHPAAAGGRPGPGGGQPGAVRDGPGRRQLPGRRAAGHGAAGHRCGHRVQPGAAGRHGRRQPHEAGLASGVVNTSFMMGGALGLAVLVSLSSWRTGELTAGGLVDGRGADRRLPGRLRRRGRDGRGRGGGRWPAAPAPADAAARRSPGRRDTDEELLPAAA